MPPSIKVGVYGWQHFAAKADLYPDDLPPDWRLSFYANEFASACLDFPQLAEEWVLFTQWVEDLPQSFQLSLALPVTASEGALSNLSGQGEWAISYLLSSKGQGARWLPSGALHPLLSSLGIHSPQQIVEWSSCWTPDSPVNGSAIAIFPSGSDMRQYRQWIEQWVEGNSEQELTLWLDGAAASYSELSGLKTLVELMGY